MNEISILDKKDYQELVELWEASVRATHFFLKEKDIAFFKPLLLNSYLDAVELRGIRNSDKKLLASLEWLTKTWKCYLFILIIEE